MKKTLKLTACVLALVLTLSLLPLPQLHAVELNDLPTTIDAVTVLPANVEFFAGEAPNPIGRIQNDARVSIVYESWSSWGKDGSLDLWSSHPYGSKTFTAFKEGVTYDYNIALEAAEGYVFADDVNLTVAGLSPAADCLVDKSSPNKRIYSRFYTFTCEKAPTLKDFEINGATLSLKAGKPESESAVFTGKVPDGAGYTVEEYWSIEEDGTTKFYTSKDRKSVV